MKFESNQKLTKADLREIYGFKKKGVVSSSIIPLILLTCGSTMLFFTYTVALGIILIFTSILLFFLARKAQSVSSFDNIALKDNPYLDSEVSIGFDNAKVWFRSDSINAESAWENLITWRVNGPWFTLTLNGLPQIHAQVEALLEANVLDSLVKLCQQNIQLSKTEPEKESFSSLQVTGSEKEFETLFGMLAESENPEAFLSIIEEETEQFIQCRYFSDSGFELDYPVFNELQIAHKDAYLSLLAKKNIQTRFYPENKASEYFIDCDLDWSPRQMATFAKEIFSTAFGIKDGAKYKFHCSVCLRHKAQD